MSVFEISIVIKFISNYFTCLHNILKTLSFKHILKIQNISTIFYIKTWKTKH